MNIIRPSNAYCSGQLLHRVIPRTFLSIINNQKIPLHGGGKAMKSYIHATDLANAIHVVIKKGKNGEIYNVGPKKPTSIKEVVTRVGKLYNLKLNQIAKVTDDRLGQDSKYWLDSSKINNLGWKQEINWDDGLQEVKLWFEKYKSSLKELSPDYIMRG